MKTNRFLLAAVFTAIAFTFTACGGDDDGGDDTIGNSSSSGGGAGASSSDGRQSSSSFVPSGSVVGKCNGVDYYENQYCYNNSKIGNFCGERTEEFDPDKYECRDGGKIYLKTPVAYGDDNYDAVLIGMQTWMAKNLNYNAAGSKCYAEGVSGVANESIAKNCNTYGRLYDWNTAMGGAASADANPSGIQGVCPSGWHLPSSVEWSILMAAAGDRIIAGRHLKATSGWNLINEESGNGDDKFGFFALPNGNGNSYGNFNNIGNYGYWWTSLEATNTDLAYYIGMAYSSDNFDFGYYTLKSQLHSVRCLMD
jgi:uncharacterized protein (TIGR02145 family)